MGKVAFTGHARRVRLGTGETATTEVPTRPLPRFARQDARYEKQVAHGIDCSEHKEHLRCSKLAALAEICADGVRDVVYQNVDKYVCDIALRDRAIGWVGKRGDSKTARHSAALYRTPTLG